MMNLTNNIANNKSDHFCESSNSMDSEKIDSHLSAAKAGFRGNDRKSECHSCPDFIGINYSRNPELILFISIATTFKSWATITKQLLALAKYGFPISAKAHFNSHIYPRPEGRGNSIFFLLGSS